jgi:hypothetical protein
MTCLGITGEMRTVPTWAMEVLLRLPPLHLQVEVEAKVGNNSLLCNDQWKPTSEEFGHAYMTQDMRKKPILQMAYDKMIPRHVYDKHFRIRFPDISELKVGFQSDRKGGGLSGTQMVPRKIKRLGLWRIAMGQGENLVLTLGSI